MRWSHPTNKSYEEIKEKLKCSDSFLNIFGRQIFFCRCSELKMNSTKYLLLPKTHKDTVIVGRSSTKIAPADIQEHIFRGFMFPKYPNFQRDERFFPT